MQVRESIKVDVNEAVKSNEFAFYYFLRSKYLYPIILDYTPEKVAVLTGFSVNTVRKYVGHLVKIKYLIRDGKNLKFKKQEFNVGEYEKLDIRPWTSFGAFMRRVYTKLIECNQKKQGWCRSIKSYYHRKQKLVKGFDPKKYKKFNKYFRVGEKYCENVLLSTRSLAKVFRCSQSKARNILKSLVKNGYIKVKEIIEKSEMSVAEFKAISNYKKLDGYFFVFNGLVYQHKGITIKRVRWY